MNVPEIAAGGRLIRYCAYWLRGIVTGEFLVMVSVVSFAYGNVPVVDRWNDV